MTDAQNTVTFSDALVALKAGDAISREGWNGPGQKLELQTPDEHSKMTIPYIYITTVQGDLVPWLASQTDLLAEDWTLLAQQAESVNDYKVSDAQSEGPLAEAEVSDVEATV